MTARRRRSAWLLAAAGLVVLPQLVRAAPGVSPPGLDVELPPPVITPACLAEARADLHRARKGPTPGGGPRVPMHLVRHLAPHVARLKAKYREGSCK